MYKPSEKKFVEQSLKMIQNKLEEEGIITRKIDNFKDVVIDIGKLYHDFMKKEEL